MPTQPATGGERFTVESHRYRNGGKPQFIGARTDLPMYVPAYTSVAPDGFAWAHDSTGKVISRGGEPHSFDLIPIPPPPRPWNCPDDVPDNCRMIYMAGVWRTVRFVTENGIGFDGGALAFTSWAAFASEKEIPRWRPGFSGNGEPCVTTPATRTGEYQPCVTGGKS